VGSNPAPSAKYKLDKTSNTLDFSND